MHRALRAAGLALVPVVVSGLTLAPTVVAALAAAPAAASSVSHKPNPRNPVIHVRPLVISQFCDEAVNPTHGEHCVQASGGNGNFVTLFAPDGQANQQFNVFSPGPGNTSCGDNITDVNCPFPGVTPGEQIAVIGGQAPENAGSCVAMTALRTQAKLAPCNGGTGTIVVIDNHAMEFALLSRQNGGKTYMCENPINNPTERTVFVAGDCQWSNLAQ